MKSIAKIVSWLALAGTILPSLLFFTGRMTLDQAKLWMLVSTVAWFAATPLWMEHDTGGGESH
jgi:hypothetical protein